MTSCQHDFEHILVEKDRVMEGDDAVEVEFYPHGSFDSCKLCKKLRCNDVEIKFQDWLKSQMLPASPDSASSQASEDQA